MGNVTSSDGARDHHDVGSDHTDAQARIPRRMRATGWTAIGTRGRSHCGADVVTLSWNAGELEGPGELVAEWRRLCDRYAGGRFFVGAGKPLRFSNDPASDPVASFLVASQFLPIWIDQVTWTDDPPSELAEWSPRPRNVSPAAPR